MQLTKKYRWNIVLVFGILVFNLMTVLLFFRNGNEDSDFQKVVFCIPDAIILHYKNEVLTIDRDDSCFDEIVELNQTRTDIVEYFVEVSDSGYYSADEYYMEYCYEESQYMLVETKLEIKTYITSKLCFVLTGEQNNCVRIYSDNGELLVTLGQLNSDIDLVKLCAGLICND